VCHATGESIAAHNLGEGASGVMMIPIPRPGVYHGVTGLESARQTPGVTEILISAAPGQRYQTYPDESSYLGFIFARGSGPDMVTSALRGAHACLEFDLATELNTLKSVLPGRTLTA
jgi:hypothetical protein